MPDDPQAAAVRDLGTIMGIWAHPDDETFGSGGLMSLAVQNGQKCICITATKGEKGVQDPERWPPDRLAEIRSQELQAALRILGVQEHHWLGFQDGECQKADGEQAVTRLKKFIEQYRPDTIVTFGPDGLTGHPDHQTVSKWVSDAVRGTSVQVLQVAQLRDHYQKMRQADEQFNMFFNVDEPQFCEEKDGALVLRLPVELIDKKHRALSSMPSQYEKMFKSLGEENVKQMFSVEAFKLAEPS